MFEKNSLSRRVLIVLDKGLYYLFEGLKITIGHKKYQLKQTLFLLTPFKNV